MKICLLQIIREEMEAYGINEELIQFVKELHYGMFRGYNDSNKETIDTHKRSDCNDEEKVLNPWQARHATLLVRAVKEVNELRFVLCPRYMGDSEFWDIYFELVKDKLPPVAYTWKEGDDLPPSSDRGNQNDVLSVDYLGNQLRTLSVKASHVVVKAGESAGVDISNLLHVSNDTSNVEENLGGGRTSMGSSVRILDSDPDLEEYLQVAEESGTDGVNKESYESDLDDYINELSGELVGDKSETGDISNEYEDEDIDAMIQGLDEDEP